MALSLGFVLALCLQSGNSAPYDVAYVAKYYGSAQQDSYYQVYLCDHQGKSRACLTNNKKDYGSVRWVNNDEIALIENGLQSDTLQIYNLKTGQYAYIKAFAKSDRPVLLSHPYIGTNVCLLRTGTSPYRYYAVDSNALRPIANPPASAFRYTGGQMNFYANDQFVSLTQSKGDVPGSVRWTFSKDSGWVMVASEPGLGFFEAYQPTAKSQLWVNIWSGNDRIGYRSDLHVLDFAKGTSKTIIANAHNLSFHFDSRYWSATSPYYQYTTLKDGNRVRVNTGFIGDRTTGNKWTIASGDCHVRSISLKPGM